MAGSDTTSLPVASRPVEGSRATRRLRRRGLVPGVLYGGDGEPRTFEVDAKLLRNTLAHSGAVLDVSFDGSGGEPVIVKDIQRHPVRGETMHVDLLRVNMSQPIHSTVTLELVGADVAPGVVEGGVLSQETRELNIEALPGDLPDVITHDVSALGMNETLTLSVVTAPSGVTLLDDLEETVIATVTPPTQEPTEDDIETETAVIGEEGEIEAGKAAGDTGDEAAEGAADPGDSPDAA
ncbi:MAG: 50S ribosomal protein L25 [Actinomycetota bacterium]|nr:50S ribosomal protein L25 [Actinomycetota bacterium]